MPYKQIPPFYEYPHSRGEPCDCLDCKELSIIKAIEAAAKRRPHGRIKVKLEYIGRSKRTPVPIDD